jgi:hypothetical protein
MVINKTDLILAIDTEIDDDRPAEETEALVELRAKVDAEQVLTYQEYEWLAYLVGNYREAQLA